MAPDAAVTLSSAPGASRQPQSFPPKTWPGTPSSSTQATPVNPVSEVATDRPDQVAVITAQNPDSEVNVRSLPSPDADPIGTGQVGDRVKVGRSEAGTDGYLWYSVTFEATPESTSTAGWMREDFLEIQSAAEARAATPADEKDVLKESLDEHCGGAEAIAAFFVTQNYTIYFCNRRGQWLYLSQEKGSSQVIVAQDVEVVGGGYLVTNGDFEYRIDASGFTVVRMDDEGKENEILRESVVYSERY